MILIPVKPDNPAEPDKPVHQLQITTSTTNPKVSAESDIMFNQKIGHLY